MKIKRNLAISDNGFLFNPSTGDSYSVNPIGQELIGLIKEGKTKDEIKQIVLDKYLTDEATFEKDFYDFKHLLIRYKLVDENG